MLDLNLIRENPEIVRKALADRQMDASPVDIVLSLDTDRRNLLTQVEKLKAERNVVSKEISQSKDPAARQAKIDAMREVGDRIAELDETVRQVDTKPASHPFHDPQPAGSANPLRQRRERKCGGADVKGTLP